MDKECAASGSGHMCIILQLMRRSWSLLTLPGRAEDRILIEKGFAILAYFNRYQTFPIKGYSNNFISQHSSANESMNLSILSTYYSTHENKNQQFTGHVTTSFCKRHLLSKNVHIKLADKIDFGYSCINNQAISQSVSQSINQNNCQCTRAISMLNNFAVKLSVILQLKLS